MSKIHQLHSTEIQIWVLKFQPWKSSQILSKIFFCFKIIPLTFHFVFNKIYSFKSSIFAGPNPNDITIFSKMNPDFQYFVIFCLRFWIRAHGHYPSDNQNKLWRFRKYWYVDLSFCSWVSERFIFENHSISCEQSSRRLILSSMLFCLITALWKFLQFLWITCLTTLTVPMNTL